MLEMDQEDISCSVHRAIRLYHPVEMGEPACHHDATGKLDKRSWFEKGLCGQELHVAKC